MRVTTFKYVAICCACGSFAILYLFGEAKHSTPRFSPGPTTLQPPLKSKPTFSIPLAAPGSTVAIVTATRSTPKWKPGQSALESILLPSLFKTISDAEQQTYTIRLYIGIDFGDEYWENARGTAHTWTKWLDVRFGFYTFGPESKSRIPFREVSAAAIADGADYIVRVNDDTEFVTQHWIPKGIQGLLNFDPPTVGVVGPLCRQGNTHILTHDMIHSTHYTIFGWHYPPDFDNWWLDDWISLVYGESRTKVLRDWEVVHRTGHSGTRYSVDFSQKQLLASAVKKGQAAIKEFLEIPFLVEDGCGAPTPLARRCWELPRWNYSHLDFPGIFGASPEACADASASYCATAGEPSGAATASFLQALEPYITCEPPGAAKFEPLIQPGQTKSLTKCTGPPLEAPGRFIVDFFGVSHDVDVAEIRITELSPVVDLFVVFESDVTQRGDAKPLYFERILHRFSEIRSRIVHIVIGKWHLKHHSYNRKASQVRADNWANEDIRQEAFSLFKSTYAAELPADAIVLHGDADEFFDRQSAYAIKYCPEVEIRGAVGPANLIQFSNVITRGSERRVQALHHGPYPVAFLLKDNQLATHNCELAHPALTAYNLGGFLNPYATLAKEVSAAEGGGIMVRYGDARDRIKAPWKTNFITMKGIRTCCNDKPPPIWLGKVPLGMKGSEHRFAYLWGEEVQFKGCFMHVWL